MLLNKFQHPYLEASRKYLGLAKIYKKFNKKFLIIEIDGLSYPAFRYAMKKGWMPFLKKLHLHGFKIQPYFCGLPSNTFASQAGIFYGKNDSLPGFKFVDKKELRRYSFLQIRHVKHLEEKYYKDSFGILQNGTAITTSFSGGAPKTILTLSKILEETDPSKLGFYRYLTYYTLNPFFLSRVLYYSIKDFLIEIKENIYDILKHFVKGKKINHLFRYPLFPFKRIFCNTIFKELSVFGTIMEMYRNIPYIYLSLIGYDELGHFRGPYSHSAKSNLVAIDRAIKRIYRYTQGYDIYIISDHGMIPSIPFERIYKYSLEEFIEHCIEKNVKSDFSNENPRINLLSLKIKRLKRSLYQPINSFLQIILKVPKNQRSRTKVTKNSIQLEISSNLAHLYFTSSPQQLNLSDIKKQYRYLIDNIVQHPGVGIIIGKQNNKIMIKNKFGQIILEKNKTLFKGKRFLQDYGDEKLLIKQIKEFMKMKNIGDLIIIGNYNKRTMVAFDNFHLGTHSAFGGEQGKAFFMSKQDLNLSSVTNSKELHEIFKKYHKKNKN